MMFKKDKMRKILSVVGLAAVSMSMFALVFALPVLTGHNTASAAGISTTTPDVDFNKALNNGLSVVNLQKAIILYFIVGVMLVVFIIALSKGALNWMIAKIVGIFSKRGRRR